MKNSIVKWFLFLLMLAMMNGETVRFATAAKSSPDFVKNSKSQDEYASIAGRVTTQDGKLIAQAKVKITSYSTKKVLSRQTSSSGEYIFIKIEPGIYDVEVEKAEFQNNKRKSIPAVYPNESYVDFVMCNEPN